MAKLKTTDTGKELVEGMTVWTINSYNNAKPEKFTIYGWCGASCRCAQGTSDKSNFLLKGDSFFFFESYREALASLRNCVQNRINKLKAELSEHETAFINLTQALE